MCSFLRVSRRCVVSTSPWVSASPAAPYRTVRAVLPHTALRHRSPSGMRSPEHCSGQAVDSGGRDPAVVETTEPVPSRESVFDAGEAGQPLVDVAFNVVGPDPTATDVKRSGSCGGCC